MKLFQSLKKDISKLGLKLIIAERKDEYVYEQFVDELCKITIGDKTVSNFMNVNITDLNMDETLGFISRSLFVSKKVLVINCQTLKALDRKIGDKKDYKKIPTFDDAIISALSLTKQDVMVVVSVIDLDKRTSLYKKISTEGLVVECKSLDAKQVKQLILDICSENNQSMKQDVMDYFLSVVDMDCAMIVSELKKLSLADINAVTKSDIDKYVVRSHKYVVYELTNAVAAKDIGVSLSMLQDLINTTSPLQIVALLQRQIHLIYHLRLHKGDISKQLEINPYILNQYREQSRRFSVVKVERYMRSLLNCERDLKHSANAELLLESLVMELCL